MKLTEKDFRTIYRVSRKDRRNRNFVRTPHITAAPFERAGVVLWEQGEWPFSGWHPIREHWGDLLPEGFQFGYNWSTKPCTHCGEKMITQHPANGYCSDRCKSAKAYADSKRRGRPSRAKVLDDRDCDHCGEAFTPARKDAKFCSGKCRVAAHRAK